MRIVPVVGVLAVVLAGLAPSALAELYRWRDPQTGTVKYSSYPPPWYGDESREAAAPKVEVVGGDKPGGKETRTPADEMAEKVAEVIRFMAQRREQLLSRMTLARASAGFDSADPAFKADLQAYRAVTRELDKFDPKGAAARRRTDARVFDNLGIEPEALAARPGAGGERARESARG
ncbi:MAG: hypothetical protein AMJ64_15035, partial [Betaproteobacteria bacterium SG8_39]